MPYEEADGVSHAEVQGLLHDNASCFEIGLATVDLALLPSNIEQIGEFPAVVSQWQGTECVWRLISRVPVFVNLKKQNKGSFKYCRMDLLYNAGGNRYSG